MKPAGAFWIALALTGLTLAVTTWAWTALPPGAGVPVNYLALNGVRQTASSRAVLWVMPFVSAMVTLGLSAAAQRPSAQAATQPLETTMIAVTGLLLVTQNALVGRAFDPDFNVMTPVAMAAGVLLIAVGNYLGKARQNAVFGLRTPWSLADTTVWDRTHRFTGAGMVLSGLVLIGLAVVLRDATAIGLSIGACAAVPVLIGVARSASLHHGLRHG